MQQKALTSLLDGSSSSTTLSLKDSARRETLQQPEGCPECFPSPEAYRGSPPRPTQFSRQSGLHKILGASRRFWSSTRNGLDHVASCKHRRLMVAGDQLGAQEMLALTMVAGRHWSGKWAGCCHSKRILRQVFSLQSLRLRIPGFGHLRLFPLWSGPHRSGLKKPKGEEEK